MFSQQMFSIFSKSKNYKYMLKQKYFFTKIALSTNTYKRNYYLSTLSTSITQTITRTQKSPSIIYSVNPKIFKEFSFVLSLFYITKRSISSLDDPKDIEQAERWLKKFTKEKIPRDLITFNYTRSSGPGGQNVNKVNTKAELRFNLNDATWIPEYARKKLAIQEANRLNKKGEFVMTSDKSRSQVKNVEDCLDKLYDVILKASEIPKAPSEETLKRIEQLKRVENDRRKINKQHRSEKKSSRRIKDYD